MLDEASPWVTVKRIGATTLGKPMIAVILSTPANLEKLDRYVEISRRLADPRKLASAEADALIKEAKIITMITTSLHATEVGATQMTLELAYDVAAGKNVRLSKALEEEILYIVPTNPDGQQLVVDWYRKWLGTEYEGGSMPWLYHHYAGHDNNRDWFMLNLAETRAVFDLYFRSAVPHAVLDMHQQQSNGARLFLPPYYPPGNKNVDPVIYRTINFAGAAMQLACEERGLSGVISNAYYDAYWEGSSNQVGWWHNQIGLLSEAASVNVASPIFIEPGELRGDEAGFPRYELMINFPNPWQGGWWRLRDIVDYDRAAAESFIETCAENRERFLENYYRLGLKAVERGKTEKPFAYVIPAPQSDPVTAARLVEALMLGGVEVHRASKDFTVGRQALPRGLLRREARSAVRPVREGSSREGRNTRTRARTTRRRSRNRTTSRAGRCRSRWASAATRSTSVSRRPSIFSPNSPTPRGASPTARGATRSAPRSTLPIRRRTSCSPRASPSAASARPGRSRRERSSCPPRRGSPPRLQRSRRGCTSIFFRSPPSRPARRTSFAPRKPRSSSRGSRAWTRAGHATCSTSFKVPYANVSNKDVTENRIKGYDVLVIPNIRPSIIKDGKLDDKEDARWQRPLPPDYRGGIDKKGIENVKKFVEAGGTLICFGSACGFAIETLELPVRNVLDKVSDDDFFCPGAILKVSFKTGQPITYGMPENGHLFFANSLAFATSVPYGKFDRSVLASFTDKEPLASGLIIGGERLYRNAALVEYTVGAGKRRALRVQPAVPLPGGGNVQAPPERDSRGEALRRRGRTGSPASSPQFPNRGLTTLL